MGKNANGFRRNKGTCVDEVKLTWYNKFRMFDKFNFSKEEVEAASPYQIKINKQKNTVTVYRYEDGAYEPYKAFVCSMGKATPLGRFRIYQKHRWRALVQNTYGQYCTRFKGPILFHSV